MTRQELEQVESSLKKLVDIRRGLGGFDGNAEHILILSEGLLLIASHLLEKEMRLKEHLQRRDKK